MVECKVLAAANESKFLEKIGGLVASEDWDVVFVENLKQASDSFEQSEPAVFVVSLATFSVESLSHLGSLINCPVIFICENVTVSELKQIINSDLQVAGCFTEEDSDEEFASVLQKTVYSASLDKEFENSSDACRYVTQRLQTIQKSPLDAEKLGQADDLLGSCLNSTLSAMAGLVENMHRLINEAPSQSRINCELEQLQCPRVECYEHLIRESVETLEQTKTSFKSRRLAELRRKLQQALNAKTERNGNEYW